MGEKDNVRGIGTAKNKNHTGNNKRTSGRYSETDNGMAFISEDRYGIQTKLLSNFSMRIVAEIVKDNGQEQERLIELEGTKSGTALPRVEITFDVFSTMNWPAKLWGTSCAVEPGLGTKDQLRYAVQTLSHADPDSPVKQRTIYAHTGWRQINGGWHYLHVGGAINAKGIDRRITVEIDGLSQYSLPAPSHGPSARREAAAASLAVLDIAPLEVALPVLACVYLAPLASQLKVDFVAWLESGPKNQKSSMAGVVLGHWGNQFDRNSLTANWTDTAFALEDKLFAAKDALVVIDDYAPQPSAQSQARLDETVARVVRSCGNLAGRARGTSDLKVRPGRPPRGLAISTAEQYPQGESVTARLFAIPMEKGAVDLPALSRGQAAVSQGLLGRAMADFLRDLAGRYLATVADCHALWEGYRKEALERGLSGRVPEQVAFLQVGIDLATRHFRACGLPVADLERLSRSFDIFLTLGAAQSARVKDAQPAERFRDALLDILASGAAHVVPLEANGDILSHERTLHGPQIGWRRGAHELCLLKVPTLDAINETLRRSGSGLGIRDNALFRQLRERGWLELGDVTESGHNATRHVTIESKKQRVLVFDERALRNP